MFEEKKIVTIYSGHYYISNDPQVVIFTLLGSCIAVCLYDQDAGVGAMNHFMLPQANNRAETEQSGRFGLQSIELMIEQILKLGGSVNNLKAKVFGGARMIEVSDGNRSDVASANIRFTLEYLKKRNIPIVAEDLGGNSGRKVYYVLEDHSVFVQRLDKEWRLDGIE